jgi:hypothetical protein
MLPPNAAPAVSYLAAKGVLLFGAEMAKGPIGGRASTQSLVSRRAAAKASPIILRTPPASLTLGAGCPSTKRSLPSLFCIGMGTILRPAILPVTVFPSWVINIVSPSPIPDPRVTVNSLLCQSNWYCGFPSKDTLICVDLTPGERRCVSLMDRVFPWDTVEVSKSRVHSRPFWMSLQGPRCTVRGVLFWGFWPPVTIEGRRCGVWGTVCANPYAKRLEPSTARASLMASARKFRRVTGASAKRLVSKSNQ